MMDSKLSFRWWNDVVLWGRLIAVAVIVVCSGLAIWHAIDVGDSGSAINGSHYNWRTALRQTLSFIWYGALALIVAEIVSAIRDDDIDPISWDVPQLTRALASLVVLGGTALTVWDIYALHNVYESGWLFLNFDRGRTLSDDIRYFLEAELQTYLWQGGLLILLAALVDRLPWYGGDTPDEREVSSVASEP